MKRYQTKLRTDRPDLKDIFDEFKNLYFKDFNYSGVQLNKNYRILPHKDGRQQPIRFDGSKHIHWVENFTGTRYSLVFFMDLKVT